jgi:hypothetical protein
MIIHETNLIKFGYQWKPKTKNHPSIIFGYKQWFFGDKICPFFNMLNWEFFGFFGFLGANSTNYANFLEKSTKFSITQNWNKKPWLHSTIAKIDALKK